MRKYLPNLICTSLLATATKAASAQETGKLDFDCVFLSRPNAHKFFTVDFEKRTVNEQPAMIGPEAMHWKLGDHGYKFDRLTGILALLKASNNVLFKLQCNAVTER